MKQKKFLSLVIVSTLVSTMLISPQKANAVAAILPGAHHAVVGNDVFLGGNYIEVGVNKHGSFGTASNAPAGFHPSVRTNLGMVADGDGFNVGNASNTGDFFLPGNPYESYVVAYKDTNGTATKAQVSERNGVLGITNISTTDTSSGNTLSATTVGTTNDGKLEITQVVSFDVNDKYFNIHITYRNVSGNTIYDARYLRSVDPDQDADTKGDYSTKNSVVKNPPRDDMAIVIAKGATTNEPFMYIAADSRARASITRNIDPYNTASYNVDGSALIAAETTNDTWIAMTYDLGDIAAGQSVSLDLKNSLNPDVNAALAAVQPAVSTPAAVEITRDENTLTSELKKEDGSKFTTSSGVTYDWYRDGESVQEGTDDTYIISNSDKGKDIKLVVTYGEIELTSNIISIANDKPQVSTPAAVKITRNEDTITSELRKSDGSKFTTSAGVTYDWQRNGESVQNGTDDTYAISNADKGKSIELLATYGEIQLTSNSITINNDEPQVTTSAAVSTSSHHHHSSTTTSVSTDKTNTSDTTNNDNKSNTNNNIDKAGWTQDANGKLYLVKEDGKKTTGWKLLDNKWYFFDNNSGSMVTGWYKSESGDWTFDGKDTVGQWFHLDADGKMNTGWFKDTDGSWYFLCDGKNYGALGTSATGWQQVDGKWYYFNANGVMASDTLVGGYKLGSDGAWIE